MNTSNYNPLKVEVLLTKGAFTHNSARYLPPANEVAGRLCFYSRLWFCSSGGGGWYPSMPCSRSRGGGVLYQHALQVSRPTPRGEVEGDLAGGVSPGPQPRGKLRGIWPGGISRPTTKEEVEGEPTLPPPRDGYYCGRYASYWNAFLFKISVRYSVHNGWRTNSAPLPFTQC